MDGTVFAFDPDWVSTLNAPFMTNAFLAGLCIALAAGGDGLFHHRQTFHVRSPRLSAYRTARRHRSRIARPACFRRSWRVRSRRSTGDRCARQEGFTT